MSEITNIKDQLNLEEGDFAKLPSSLNTLTILTYIGCGLGLIGSIYNFTTTSSAYELFKAKQAQSVSTGNSMADKIISAGADIIQKSYDNRYLILIISLVGIGLCFWGAAQMRNRQKKGLTIYLIGEWLPLLISIIIFGGGLFGGMSLIVGAIVPVIFTILYLAQRKHLS
jgi:hypothetical protein